VRYIKRTAVLIILFVLALSGQTLAASHGVFFGFNTPSEIYIFPLQTTLPEAESVELSVLEALIQGPPPGSFLDRTVPRDVRVLGVTVTDGTAYVDLDEEIMFAGVGSAGEAVMLGSIVNSLCTLPHISQVQFLVSGEIQETLGGHVFTGEPLKPSLTRMFQGFPDLKGHWAEGEIMGFFLRKVIAGYPDGLFRPDQNVSRAEFIKMVVAGIGLAYGQGETFQDVPLGHWANPYVEGAVSQGLILPQDYGSRLYPDSPIPRKEMAVILARAAGLEELAESLRDAPLPYTDVADLPAWARGYIAAATSQGLLKGYPDSTFQPSGFLTRAEAAVVVTRLDRMGGPDIFIAYPKEGQVLGDGPVVVAGSARVFEGTVMVEIVAADGSALAQDFVTTEGGPAWGLWALTLESETKPVKVRAYWESPKDGSRQGIVEVNVKP